MTLTFARDSSVPDVHWVASLSDGSIVYQDLSPTRSCWTELKAYVKAKNLKILNLFIEQNRFLVNIKPYLDKDGCPQVDGYWFSQKIASIAGSSINSPKPWIGIGYVKDGHINITWLLPDGTLKNEIRAASATNGAIIWNVET
jgi:hypothetical protein